MNHQVVVFSDPGVWSFMIQMMILGMAMIAGNTLRVKIPAIRKALMPSSLIGGLLILICKLIPGFQNMISVEIMQVITYHCLGIGFVAMSLRNAKNSRKAAPIKIVENGCMTGATYLLQAIIGVVITILLYYLADGFYAAGFLTPMGYGQGPGSALSWGSIYESSYGFGGGASFGLTIASVGFLVASVIGVAYMNILKRKGKIQPRQQAYECKTIEDFENPDEIPNTESVDRFTIQVSLVMLAYFISYVIMSGFQKSGIKILQDMAWGLNFVWAIIAAYILKWILGRLGKRGWMKRGYVNNYLMDRLSGCMFDLMIIAGVASIKFEDVRAHWLPLVLICIFAAIGTFAFVLAVCRHLYKGYEYEMFLCNFGMLTGTVSNGMILLREIDPNYETPTASNQVLQNFPAMIFAAPVLLLLGVGARSLTSCYIILVVFILLFVVYSGFLFRGKIFGFFRNSKTKGEI